MSGPVTRHLLWVPPIVALARVLEGAPLRRWEQLSP